MDEVEDLSAEPTRDEDGYLYRNVVAHLSAGEAWPSLFELLEDRSFLADQAEHFNGFERSGEDVELYVIPATIRQGDWARFLRFASLALNLRQLAETLAEPDLLRALVQGGSLDLALDTASRLVDPLRRAEARAVLAWACRSRSELLSSILRGIEEDLEGSVPTATTLEAVARWLGPELESRWPMWIERASLKKAEKAGVWASVAGSWLERGETRASGLWGALAQVRDLERLQELVERLGEQDQGDLDEALARLAPLFGEDVGGRRRAFSTYLSREVRTRPEEALAAWERWTERERFPWTVDLVESSSELLRRLGAERSERSALVLDGPEAEAALRVVELQIQPDAQHATSALEAVCRLPEGPTKLHWSLRYLEARPDATSEETRRQLGAAASYLSELRYGAAAGDLRRFLDLAARHYPEEVARLVEDVVWSPSSRSETLLTLASETHEMAVGEALLENAERFAAAVSLTEAEGFKLRGELIRRVAARLCLLRRGLDRLAAATERLLPDEEDDLRMALAPELAKAGREEEARSVAAGIRDSSCELLTLVRALPLRSLATTLLEPRSLYRALASARPLEEERLALTPLLQPPFDPQDLARRFLLPLRSGDLQAQGLLRLARHTLAFQRAFYGRRQDRVAALEVARGSLAVETDERLAALTPEIAALGAEMGVKEAVAEFQEAGRRLADLATVAWRVRASALERLLFLLRTVFHLEKPSRTERRGAASVLATLGRLPIGPRPHPPLDELRSHWPNILPLLVANLERLPKGTIASVRKALSEGIAACREFGKETGEEVATGLFALCLADGNERSARVEGALASPDPDPGTLTALAYLFAAEDSSRTLEITARLPGEERDALRLRLVRHRWIHPSWAGPVARSITDPTLRDEAFVWLLLEEGADADWLGQLAAWIARKPLDPSEPGLQRLVDRLWACDSVQSRPALAEAFLRALRAVGRKGGEDVLRLWLHAHLAPKPGGESKALPLNQAAGKDLARSLALP